MTALPPAPHIGLVVEGPGDLAAVPVLLRTHQAEQGDFRDILGKPVPLNGKGRATAANGIEGYVATAMRPGCVGVIVVLDADDEAACHEGPQLLARASSVTAKPVVVALAERNYEDWLFASIETLRIGDEPYRAGGSGKSAIGRFLADSGASYVKPVWQPKLTQRINLTLARGRSQSLDRMLRRFDELRRLLPQL